MTNSVSTLSLKIPTALKTQLSKNARTKKQTISTYLRSIIMEKLEISSQKPNPFLDIVGIMNEQEADQMMEVIKTTRKNRSQSHYKNLD
jgi:hypothetical protein